MVTHSHGQNSTMNQLANYINFPISAGILGSIRIDERRACTSFKYR